jgi:hypothetical protein
VTTLDPAYPNPETLAAEVELWLQECGSCDAGLPMGCTCPPGDYRVVLLKVWRAYEGVERAIRRQVAEEMAQALETDRDHGDGLPISDTVSRYQAWTYAAALAREIGAKETS